MRQIAACHPRCGRRWELGVEGTNLRAVMAMLGVDGERSATNNVAEIEKFLGIEAARKVIIQEIVRVMSAYGIQIDHRHTMLLADCMTFKVSKHWQHAESL